MKNNFRAKTQTLVNPLNSEMWVCRDISDTKDIDGVLYIKVHKPENEKRTFLMRKDALKISKSYS